MRVLLADDSSTLPASLQEIFDRVPSCMPADKDGTPSVETVLLAWNAPAAAAAPSKSTGGSADDDGCGPPQPLPPCAPCNLQDQPELLATILDAVGIALLNRGCIAAGKKFVLAALEIRVKRFGKNHPFTALSYNSHARVLRIEDNLLAAEKEIDRALKINRKVYGRTSLPLATNLNELGAIQLYQGDFRGALKSAERGLSILKKHRVYAEDPNVSRLLDVKGRALSGQRKLGPALAALSQALKIDLKQVGPDHPKYATHRANLATVQEAQGDLSAAKEGYEHAIRVYEQVLGRGGHPNLIDTYANLGSLLVKSGDLQTAKSHICKALGLNQQLRGPGHTLVGNDHANLGRVYFAANDTQRSREQFLKALAIYQTNVKQRHLPRNHPYIKEVQIWLSRCPRGKVSPGKASQ
jgi:tetratricopeptide (TPR) repeat protein